MMVGDHMTADPGIGGNDSASADGKFTSRGGLASVGGRRAALGHGAPGPYPRLGVSVVR